jgi:hypothetical protein
MCATPTIDHPIRFALERHRRDRFQRRTRIVRFEPVNAIEFVRSDECLGFEFVSIIAYTGQVLRLDKQFAVFPKDVLGLPPFAQHLIGIARYDAKFGNRQSFRIDLDVIHRGFIEKSGKGIERLLQTSRHSESHQKRYDQQNDKKSRNDENEVPRRNERRFIQSIQISVASSPLPYP